MDILEVGQKLIARLRGLSTLQLLDVCEHLGLETEDTAEKANGRQRLVRKVIYHTNSDEVQDCEDGGFELLQGLDGFINGMAGTEVVPNETAVSALAAKPDSSDESLQVKPVPLKVSPSKSKQPQPQLGPAASPEQQPQLQLEPAAPPEEGRPCRLGESSFKQMDHRVTAVQSIVSPPWGMLMYEMHNTVAQPGYMQFPPIMPPSCMWTHPPPQPGGVPRV